MTGYRLLAIFVVAAAGCPSTSSPPIVRSPDNAAKMSLGPRAVHKGKISPDQSTWFTFEVERTCTSVTIEVVDKAQNSLLTLVARGPDGSTQTEHDKGKVSLQIGAHQIGGALRGHYHIELASSDDTRYRATVRESTTGFECGDLPPPIPDQTIRVAATGLPSAPVGYVLAPIDRWEVYGGTSRIARLTKGFDDGVEPARSAQLVDAHGQVVPDVTVDVSSSADGAEAVTGASESSVASAVAVLVALPPHKPAPIRASVIDRWHEHRAAFATIASGTFDGVAPGWRGTLDSSSGAAFEVVDVSGRSCRVRIAAGVPLAAILDASTATLAPPR